MKAVPGRQTRGLPRGARIDCVDNTGAKVVEVISVIGYHGVRRRYPQAALGDLVVCSVKKGTPEMRKTIVHVVVIRQRMPFRRPDGIMVRFEDNACVVTTETGETKGSDIKGPVAREAAERWPRIAATASAIV